MGKSKGSCFRIMDCAGGDSASTDELLPPESKPLSDKCRWSFRKRVSGPRVLSKNAILEPECVDSNKDSMEAITSSFNSAKNICVSEKSSIQKYPSKEELPVGPALSSAAVNSDVSTTVVARNDTSNDENIQDSSAIIVQTAIRGHLAVRKHRKVKNVIKLQAAVRGHLVRVQALGTLRCIRAITKMQAIFRARLESQLQEKVAGIAYKKLEIKRNGLYLPGKGNYCEGSIRFYSTRKLLSNRFAQKLLASTRKTRPIYIKCDPSKSDSVRKWLERWMTIITSDTGEENDQNSNLANKEDAKSSKLVGHEEKELAVASESKGDHNATSESNLQFSSAACLSDSSYFSSVEKNEQSRYQTEKHDSCMKKQRHIEIKEVSKPPVSFSSHILESALTPQQTDDYSSNKTESKGNNLNNTAKRDHSRPSEIEAQKVAVWPRRPCNPVFAATQSKFEDMSSNSKNVKCISSFSSAYQDCAADTRIGNYGSHLKKTKEPGFTENILSINSIIQVAASECGTEISISSTLDSPDRSETECGEIVLEIGSMSKHNYDVNTCSDNVEFQTSESNKLEETVIYASLSSNAHDVAVAPPMPQQKEPTASEEGTPRGHTAAIEPYGTPSSEISVNAGSKNKDGNTPKKKQRSSGSDRKLASRISTENLSNDSKNEKKWQSGASRTDLDDEPRMSNSNSSSLPSYMQATKSARAKVHANISPKSSPDLHDKDNHIKKRHSLPIDNGKQDSSPPMQRSTPRAQQNPKSNGMHAPHTSAERRWQR